MKKEVLLAIAIGVLLGLALMVGVELKRKGKLSFPGKEPSSRPSVSEESDQASPAPEVAIDSRIKLEIIEPEDETISSKEVIDLKGKTDPLATVIVIWEEGEDILVADEQGYFNSQINLSAGPNEIEVSAYDETNQIAKQILTITYSTAKF